MYIKKMCIEIIKIFRELMIGLFRYIPSGIGVILRRIIYRPFLKQMGKKVKIQEAVKIKWPERLSIGNRSSINEFCWIESSGGVSIGNNVWIAPRVSIVSFQHKHTLYYHECSHDFTGGGKILNKIVIEDNVWIGAHSIILSGVTVGEGCIVGAGSVVTHDVPPYSIVAGVPARVIKKINIEEFMESR